MGLVMLHPMHLRADGPLVEKLFQFSINIVNMGHFLQAGFEEPLETRPLPYNLSHLGGELGGWVAAHNNMVYIAGPDPSLMKTSNDRFTGEPRRVLQAIEPFLFNCRNQFAVNKNAGGCVAMVGVYSEDDHEKKLQGQPPVVALINGAGTGACPYRLFSRNQ